MTAWLRAALAGVVCVAILGASLVLHAWPLWTGRPVLLRVSPVDPRDPFRGEYVWLTFAEEHLVLNEAVVAATDRRTAKVRPIGTWWKVDATGLEPETLDKAVFVQLDMQPEGRLAVARAVTVADRPIDGATNLRGLIRYWDGVGSMWVEYGLDAFYLQEGRAANVQIEFRADRPVYAEVMVASNGRARVRRLLRADGSVIAD